MQLRLGNPVAVHKGGSLSCTELYEVTAKIVPQVFVDLGGTLHMTHAPCSNIVSFPRGLSNIYALHKVSSVDWPYYSDVQDERIAGYFVHSEQRCELLLMHVHSHVATQYLRGDIECA